MVDGKDTCIRVYKNKFKLSSELRFPKSNIKINQTGSLTKVIVFDMDETIGSFQDLAILWTLGVDEKNQETFNQLLDLYPEFLRTGILKILEFIIKQKKLGICGKLYVYTNNKYSPELPNKICEYLNYKLNTEQIFDKIICAFKVNNVIIEPKRTTVEKTHGDFIQCSVLPKKSEICFIDDKYYKKMDAEKVYYIQPQAYCHDLSANIIIERFIDRFPNAANRSMIVSECMKNQNVQMKTEIHQYVFQKMMYYIREFFYLTTRRLKTKKRRIKIGNFTRKIKNKR